MRLTLVIFAWITLLIMGCSTQQTPSSGHTEADKPMSVESEENYHVWKHKGRIYVVGQEKTNTKFEKFGHLPYTRTLLGAGPNGETVVFEVDKKNPKLADKLQARYTGKPFPVQSEKGYHVWEHHGRIYVISNKKTNEKFKKFGHLPYTRTLLGAGPNGETVVFEVDKKNPKVADKLESKYTGKPFMVNSEMGYHVWEHHGRIYVIGNEKTNEKFKKFGHLPYTRTLLGAGPNGETVVFEVDKKNKMLADQLMRRFQK